jgi:hypothetical protein
MAAPDPEIMDTISYSSAVHRYLPIILVFFRAEANAQAASQFHCMIQILSLE